VPRTVSAFTSAASLLRTAVADVSAQRSAHIAFAATLPSSAHAERIVADVGEHGGTETVRVGAATLVVRVTPGGGYIRGSSSGLTSLYDLSAAQAKTLGTKWESWKPGTSEYANLKANVTVASLKTLFPKADGTKVTAARSAGSRQYILTWTTPAAGSTPKLLNTLHISAGKMILPILETSTDAAGLKVTTRISKWGEPVVEHRPPADVTIASAMVKG